jgi:hypothetical protein
MTGIFNLDDSVWLLVTKLLGEQFFADGDEQICADCPMEIHDWMGVIEIGMDF